MNRNNDDNDKVGDNDSSDSDDNDDMISQPGADTVPFSIYTRMLECC